MKRLMMSAAVIGLLAAGAAHAQTIYPVNRATILAGSKFDLKVEFAGVVKADAVKVTVNGVDHVQALGRAAEFVEKEKGVEASAVILRDVQIDKPGTYTIVATDGANSKTVTWEVYGTGARKAKNVIFFIGDGMTVAIRTAARILSKGIEEGRYKGTLAMDDMPRMALIGTSGVDSVVTDSANSAHAYTTGHKSSVNALGVYADRTPDTLDDPRVENLTSLAKRRLGMAVGVITNTEIEDATPASMVAHTRRRSDYPVIVQQFLEAKPDVMMGGGSLAFLPKSVQGSRRNDEIDYFAKFREAGYGVASTKTELLALAEKPETKQLLGIFNTGNIDTVYDRKFTKKGTVGRFPDQPDLTDEVRAAIATLSKNENGFLLMVESGLIDKMEHRLDWERAAFETILLDNVVKIAKDFAANRDDTLVMVLPDHTHAMGVVGTTDDDAKGDTMREKFGTYDQAKYPNYPAPDAEGYPPNLDVSRRLKVVFGTYPDYYETYHPKADLFTPAVKDAEGKYVANPAYKDLSGAVMVTGNLPTKSDDQGVHAADDGVLTAMGPGSERIHGFMENVDVFHTIVEALGLGDPAVIAKK